ncbi:MAG: hypothetical protein HW416_1222 [Chloroflexi bacterium]|nr:hypothetical protein [Chloroflexota bacterium]
MALAANAKQQALDLIERLPDDITMADILDDLYFRIQVERGLQDIADGRTVSHQELKAQLAEWRNSAGR